MRNLILLSIFLIGMISSAICQDPSALVDYESTTQGVLIPRMTHNQRTLIASPATGLLVYQIDSAAGFWFYDGFDWNNLSIPGQLADKDNDTKIHVEKSADEDMIRFDVGGMEGMLIDSAGKVGIGIDTPQAKLHLKGGCLLIEGEIGELPISGPGRRLMWIAERGAFRAGSVSGDDWDDGLIGNTSFVAGGQNNRASGSRSFAGAGYGNKATNTYSVTLGGLLNLSSGYYSFVGGGDSDTASGHTSFIGGGRSNVASGYGSFIGGGDQNIANDSWTFIGGGKNGSATGGGAFVGGGDSLTASGIYSFAGGGSYNVASGYSSFVGGGSYNTASGFYDYVAGGTNNSATGSHSIAGGSYGNIASGIYSATLGGYENRATINHAFTGGGSHNVASGLASFVGGGSSDTASGHWSFIGGGSDNLATNNYSFVGGGRLNVASGQFSFIGGGDHNSATDYYSFVGGGVANTASGLSSFAGGGFNGTASGSNSFTGGGENNTANGFGSCTVGGSADTASGAWSFTGAGTRLLARSYAEAVFGTNNLDYIPASSFGFNASDRLFVIGNGSSASNRSNAVTVLKNGNVGVGFEDPRLQLHISQDTSNLLSTLKNFTTGLIISGSSKEPRLYFEHLNAPTGNKVMLIDCRNGRMEWNSLNDDASAFITQNILVIKAGGNIGFGLENPTHPLQFSVGVAAGAHCTAAGVWTNGSDRRLKKGIKPTAYGLNEVMALQPVDYQMRSNGEPQIGLIAQDVREILPELVSGLEGDLENGETLGLSYGNLTAVLVKAIQEQQDIIDRQQEQMDKWKAEMSEIRKLLMDQSAESN